MKILLVSDYFYPFTPGGSEWSVHELAQALKKENISPTIVTLNYGAKEKEAFKGVEVIRLPFFKKLKEKRKVVSPFWQNNPIFWTTSAYHLIKVVRAEKPDVIHVNGKFLIPAAIISKFVNSKSVIVTLRDKQLLCPIGKCFFEKNRLQACSLKEYIFSEIPWFFNNYHNSRNPLKFTYVFIGAFWARLSNNIIKFFAKQASAIIAISNSQKEYLEKNGFAKVKVIYNTGNFAGPKTSFQKSKKVVFAGKLSKGKGGEVLLDTIEQIAEKKKIEFIFAGSIDLKEKVSDKLKNTNFKKTTRFLGGRSYQDLHKLIISSSAIVMPSIYPEAFGRVALEALSIGVPAIVSDTGGLPEIIEDKKTGRVVNVDANSLKEAIIDVVDNESTYKNNIKKDYQNLKNKFYQKPLTSYLKLYKELSK